MKNLSATEILLCNATNALQVICSESPKLKAWISRKLNGEKNYPVVKENGEQKDVLLIGSWISSNCGLVISTIDSGDWQFGICRRNYLTDEQATLLESGNEWFENVLAADIESFIKKLQKPEELRKELEELEMRDP